MWASLVAQMVKNPPAVRGTWVRALGWEDPLEEGMASHCSILAWRIPMDRGAWRSIDHGVTKSWTQLSDEHFLRCSPRKLSCKIPSKLPPDIFGQHYIMYPILRPASAVRQLTRPVLKYQSWGAWDWWN